MDAVRAHCGARHQGILTSMQPLWGIIIWSICVHTRQWHTQCTTAPRHNMPACTQPHPQPTLRRAVTRGVVRQCNHIPGHQPNLQPTPHRAQSAAVQPQTLQLKPFSPLRTAPKSAAVQPQPSAQALSPLFSPFRVAPKSAAVQPQASAHALSPPFSPLPTASKSAAAQPQTSAQALNPPLYPPRTAP